MKKLVQVACCGLVIVSSSALAGLHWLGMPVTTTCEAAKRHIVYINSDLNRNVSANMKPTMLKLAHYEAIRDKTCYKYYK